MMKYNHKKVEDAVRLLIEGIGDDPNREGLIETPRRVSQLYEQILNGYDEVDDITKQIKLFDDDAGNMVILKDAQLWSTCEHHFLPFFGKMHVAYIPAENKVIGLSKIIRIARFFAKRLQVQERLTKQIAEAIEKYVPNKGVAVRIEAEHFCMILRGIKTPGVKTITTQFTGLFKEDLKTQSDFINAIK